MSSKDNFARAREVVASTLKQHFDLDEVMPFPVEDDIADAVGRAVAVLLDEQPKWEQTAKAAVTLVSHYEDEVAAQLRQPLTEEEKARRAARSPGEWLNAIGIPSLEPTCGTCGAELIGPHEGDKWCPNTINGQRRMAREAQHGR